MDRLECAGESKDVSRAGVADSAAAEEAGAGVAEKRPPRRPPAPKMLSLRPLQGVPGPAEPARLKDASSRLSLKKLELNLPTGDC
jgi:hypothetical protein